MPRLPKRPIQEEDTILQSRREELNKVNVQDTAEYETRFTQLCAERIASDINFDIAHGITSDEVEVRDICGKLRLPRRYLRDSGDSEVYRDYSHTPCKTLHAIAVKTQAVVESRQAKGGLPVVIHPPAPFDTYGGKGQKTEYDLITEARRGECANNMVRWALK